MVWFILLCVMILIGFIGSYKFRGEGYSAGRGMFKNSDDYIPDDKEEFSDYNPYEHKNMRK